MKKTLLLISLALAVVAIGGAIVLATGKSQPQASHNMDQVSGKSAVTTNMITIKDFSFTPSVITVKTGTKVTWTNADSVHHTITADTASNTTLTSGSIGQSEAYSFTFSKAGTYSYHCTPHPYMRGSVIVIN